MSNPSFNLVDEPWIPVLDADGSPRQYGLREVFARAPEIRFLSGELPTMNSALLRLLEAILMRSIDAERVADPVERWADWWESGALPLEQIWAYLDTWRHRFDLFDSEAPFYQVADLHNAKNEWRGLNLIVPDCPDDEALFRRRSTELPLTPGEAARWLVHAQAYDFSGIKTGAVGDDRVKGGRGYPLGVGWCGWLGGTVVEGDDLRETLLLNLVGVRSRDVRDIPIWEEPPLTPAERTPDQRGPFGQIGLLTWPQRRIRLRHEDGLVTASLVCNGDPIDYVSQLGNEQFTGWRYSGPQSTKFKRDVYMPRTLERDRALWRGIESVLPGGGETTKGKSGSVASFLPAGVLEWVSVLRETEVLDPGFLVRLRVTSMEYGPQMASVESVHEDHLEFAAALLDLNGHLRGVAIRGAEAAQGAVLAVGSLAGNLAIASGGDRSTPATEARARAFDEVDGRYRRWLRGLTPQVSGDEALSAWFDEVRTLARRIAEDLLRRAPATAWTGRVHDGRVYSTGQADVWFRIALGKAVPSPGTEPDIVAPVGEDDREEE